MRTTRIVATLACLLIPGVSFSDSANPPIGTRYLHTDHRGDVVLMTDSNGNVVSRTDHRPWGDRGARTTGTPQVRRTFDGWEKDDASSLLYAGARYFDPRLGRFLSVDPARQAVYAALGGAPLELDDRDGRAGFRFKTADGIPAFIFNEDTERYEKIEGVKPKTVYEKDGRLSTDVYHHEENCRWGLTFTWDASIMSGLRRADIANKKTVKGIIEAYTAEMPPTETRRKAIGAIYTWVYRHRVEEGATPSPVGHEVTMSSSSSIEPEWERRLPLLPDPDEYQPELPVAPGVPRELNWHGERSAFRLWAIRPPKLRKVQVVTVFKSPSLLVDQQEREVMPEKPGWQP